MIFFDTETCGLHGPIVLLQWAEGDGEIHLHEVWRQPVKDTIELIEKIVNHKEGVVGFNLAFDWFHICQTYTTLQLIENKDEPPDITEYAIKEKEARDGKCLKPVTACDLMLHARKGEYQSTMDRNDIRIKKVPTQIAHRLAAELGRRVPLKDVYFARLKDKKRRWQVQDILDDVGDVIPDFKDIVLKFAPSSALKALAVDALGLEEVTVFSDVDLPDAYKPAESGFAPYALSPFFQKKKNRKILRIPKPGMWYGKWPSLIKYHISHWAFNKKARKYAEDDVVYTRALYYFFNKPEMGDDDSILACMVGANRWRGYAVDIEGIQRLKEEAEKHVAEIKSVVNFNSQASCKAYLKETLSDLEVMAISDGDKMTTKGVILEEIASWTKEGICPDCKGMGCDKCKDGLVESNEPHEAAKRAQLILEGRHSAKEVELYTKLLMAGRFHASLKVIGTLSSRMSGADGLNPQGIKHAKYVRKNFKLALPGMILCGGDFDGFEVSIADAVYADPELHKDLLSGKKFHGIFGQHLFPELSYEELLATEGLAGDANKYVKAKSGVFLLFYMGEAYSLMHRLGLSEEVAENAFHSFMSKYKVFAKKRRRFAEMFCSMEQKGGIGSKVTWREPDDFIESILGFRRYFTLENRICKALFDLAENPPREWLKVKMKVVRRDREQSATGAARSALFAAAFALQASNMRAAGNHVIQSPGGQITKSLQCHLWELQPAGIHDWKIQPLNIHDEIQSPCVPELADKTKEIVDAFIENMRHTIPLLSMTWKTNLDSWADK